MLNEMMEFEAYFSDPQSKQPRLQPKLLTDSYKQDRDGYKLRGLDQIMTIILRDFLFSDPVKDLFDGNGLITDEGISASKELLNKWSGFYENLEEETGRSQVSKAVSDWMKKHPKEDGWLKKYWIFHYKEVKGQKKAGDEWYKFARTWCEKYNSSLSYQAESTTFDNIIANAIERGPLRERYCVVNKKDNGQKIGKIKDLYGFIFPEKGNRAPQEKICHKMLKNIAAFLIAQDEHPGKQKEVLLQRLRLFGWYGTDDGDGKSKLWCFEQFLWNGKSIIYRHSGSDYAKFGIKQDYIDEFGFQLIDPEDAKDYWDEYWILKDGGHGEKSPLEILNLNKI